MSIILQLYACVYIYASIQRKKIERVEKGVRGKKGIKGVRDTFREIDEKISKNKSID